MGGTVRLQGEVVGDDAESLEFWGLFEGRLLVVPDYQRGYAWEASHLQDFLDDLEILSEDQAHYTGTVVLHEQTHVEVDTRAVGTGCTTWSTANSA